MREYEIRSMPAANAKRNALMLSQWEFMNTRMMAFENVLKSSGFWNRVIYFLRPLAFLDAVDALNMALLEEGKRKAQEAATKPRLTVVGANGKG